MYLQDQAYVQSTTPVETLLPVEEKPGPSQIDGASECWASHGSALFAILLTGAILRLLLWSSFRNDPIHIWDERDYNTLAVNLIRHGEFTFAPGETPTSLRPPLYPAMIAAVYRTFGEQNFAAVRLLQTALSLLTVALVYRLALVVASPRIAIWAAGLCCFYPSLVINNNLLLTETLFTLVLTASCYLLVLSIRRESLAYVTLAGVVLGLAALTRSVVWLAPPLLAVFLLLSWKGSWRNRLLAAGAVTAAFAVTIAPWAIRNSRLQQTFVAIDVMGGRNFMMGNYRYTPLYRSWDAISLDGERSWDHEVASTYPPEERQTQGHVDRLALRQGLAFIRENPGLSLLRSIVKFFDFWGLERELIAGAGRGYFGTVTKEGLIAVTVLINGSYVATVFLAIFGALFVPPNDRRAHWLFLSVIVFVCGIHTIVFGHSRYHLPLIPLLLIYAASALTHAGAIWQSRATKKFACAVSLCVILATGWAWNFVAVDWERFVAAWAALA